MSRACARRDRVTGEIVTLQNVHAADIGRLINPMQCRDEIEGAIAMGFGWALYEKMVFDENGATVNPALRDYRASQPSPTFPAAKSIRRHLRHGRSAGAKAQGECAINAVAPAIAMRSPTNGGALSDLPLMPDRIFDS